MDWMNEFIIPVFKALAYGIFITFFGWMIYRIFRGYITPFKLFFKYKIFRMKFDEAKAEWCFNSIQNGNTESEAKKGLLLDGRKKKEIAEIMYIYRQIDNKLKGGYKI